MKAARTSPEQDRGSPAHARAVLRAQDELRRAVGAAFTSDGPLAVLLFLYGQGDGPPVRTAACCEASPGPRTTVLRWITALADAGLVRQSPDPADRRVTLLTLAPSAEAALRGWLHALAPSGAGIP